MNTKYHFLNAILTTPCGSHQWILHLYPNTAVTSHNIPYSFTLFSSSIWLLDYILLLLSNLCSAHATFEMLSMSVDNKEEFATGNSGLIMRDLSEKRKEEPPPYYSKAVCLNSPMSYVMWSGKMRQNPKLGLEFITKQRTDFCF